MSFIETFFFFLKSLVKIIVFIPFSKDIISYVGHNNDTMMNQFHERNVHFFLQINGHNKSCLPHITKFMTKLNPIG